MTKTIYFYHQHEPYFEFTNFYMRPIVLKDKEWPSAEHYFQAQKFAGTPLEEEVRLTESPRAAFSIPRIHSEDVRPDWFQINVAVMRDAVRAKFFQHADLGRMLLKTGDARLVEHTANDKFWGDGGDGSGQNKLGKILMEIRAELKKKAG